MYLTRRPEEGLGDDHAVAVEGDGGAFVELVAQGEGLADATAEGLVVGAGQDSVDRQVVRGCAQGEGSQPALRATKRVTTSGSGRK